ncbi:MAG TPA: LacI family DNA-binding transcriptional regulator [Pseudonocardia sp.]|uniref:LacI family DNA-binding transcriptional regulator n=1 Tax=Pseudonocardia sp. TaxID=60912 RepID=UPI002ED94F8A
MSAAKRVRMADVAELAGVSVSTVSHVLNATRFVAEETRSRVEQAAASLGYAIRQHRDAATGPTIGLALTGASNPYLAELILGVESEARRAGYAMLFCDTHDEADTERDAVALLQSRQVDGVVLAPTWGWERLTLPLLRKHNTPFVLVDRFTEVPCDQVGTDSEAAACRLVEHLIKLGHTRVGMVVGLAGLSTSAERVRGYRRAHRVCGLAVQPELLVDGESSVTGGRRAALRLLRGARPPTALFAANNAMTIGTLLALREENLLAGRDIALVSFDDLEWAEAMTPPLTAAAQPLHAIGARAVQLLARRLADPLASSEIVRLPASLEHRHSCGCGVPAAIRTPVSG